MAKALNKYALLLDDGALRAVERLQATYDFRTKADVYDFAIRILTWATEQQANGFEFGRHKGEEFQPLNMLREPDLRVWRESTPANGALITA